MSLTINASQLTTPKTVGLVALNSANSGDGKDTNETRQAFDSFVGETFYSQMIKSMHKLHGKPAYFYGGRAEEAFQQQLDQTWSEQMTKATAQSFTGPMFEHFMLSRQ